MNIIITHQVTLSIFIDIPEAFGTVNYKVLMNKLENYGIKGNNLKWFNEYLNKSSLKTVYFFISIIKIMLILHLQVPILQS